MDILNNKQRGYSSDINHHFEEVENDLNRIKLDNNRNFYLTKVIDNIIVRIRFIKELILLTPKVYLNIIYDEMKHLYQRAFGELDGFNIVIKFKKDTKPERMGFIKLVINKKILEDDRKVS